MTDIIDRLRLLQSGAAWVCRETAATLEDAADEIDRLQKRCDTLEQLLQPNPDALYRLAVGRKIMEERG